MGGIYSLLIGCVVVLASPFMMLIALGIVTTSGLPVLFRQSRVGLRGKPFILYKFRTMMVGAEHKQVQLVRRNEADGPVFKIHNDPRFTRIGKFLSHTGLDELPQLFNVIKGEMALIGPRPLPLNEAKKLTKKQFYRHHIKPGIISPWMLEGYHRDSFDLWMQKDLGYVHKKSLIIDLTLLIKTGGLFISLLVREVKSLL